MRDLLTLLDEFILERQSTGCSPKTVSWYRERIGHFAEYLSPDGHIEEIDTKKIRHFFVYLQTEHRPWQNSPHVPTADRRLSGFSIHGTYRAMRAFFNFLEREEVITASPMAQVRPPKTPILQPKALSPGRTKALMDAANHKDGQGRRNYALILLMLDTGLRASETVGLMLDHLDIQGGRAKVMGKGWKQRTVPIGFVARRALSRYINRYRPESPSNCVFLKWDGQAMTQNALKLLFRRLSKKAGFKVTPHMLRHTFATNYLRNGGDIFTLQRILGHSTLDMVRRYASTIFEDVQRVHGTASPVDRLGT